MAGQSADDMKSALVWGGALLMLIIFIGLTVMLYVQDYVRKKHEAAEREKYAPWREALRKASFCLICPTISARR